MEHSYAKLSISLSVYAKNLDSAAKHDYINKLRLVKSNNSVVVIDDPYVITDWKSDKISLPSVTMADVNSYLSKFPGQHSKAKEAYNYVMSGKVQNTFVHIPIQAPDFAVMKASVHPSMKVNNPPYKPWVICTGNGEIRSAHCTCIAGLGEVCSHVMAVLYAVQLAVQVDVTGVPTEKRSMWNNSFSKKVKAAPLKNVSLKKVKLDENSKYQRQLDMLPTYNDEYPPLDVKEIETFRQIVPNAVCWTAITDDSDTLSADEENEVAVPPTLAEIAKNYSINDLESLKFHFNLPALKCLELQTRTQNSLLWKTQRRGRITASNFGEILKRTTYSPAFIKKFIELAKEINVPSLKWGKKKEITAYRKYLHLMKQQHVKFSLRKAGLHISATDPYLGCSPDGIVECECCGKGVIEIKCPYSHRDKDPRTISNIDSNFYIDTDGTRKEQSNYYAQVQGHMAITETNYCDFIVYTQIDIHIHRIYRDAHYWENNKETLKAFFFNYIVPSLKKL